MLANRLIFKDLFKKRRPAMNYFVSERELFNSWPKEEALAWIKNNKPDHATTKQLAKQFLLQTEIVGDEKFKTAIPKLVKKTAAMAVGAAILHRIVNEKIPLIIAQGKTSFYTENNQQKPSVVLSKMSTRTFFEGINANNEIVLCLAPKEIEFIHELIHVDQKKNQPLTHILSKTKPTITSMDDAFEEGAITGFLHLKKQPSDETSFPPEASSFAEISPETSTPSIDFCCENTALMEMDLPFRINHHGFCLGKGWTIYENFIKAGRPSYLQAILFGKTHPVMPDKIRLKAAIALRSVGGVDYFLKAGTKTSPSLYKPLYADLSFGGLLIFDLLKKQGVQPSEKTMISAIRKRATGAQVLKLVEVGGELNENVLDQAIQHNPDIVPMLLAHPKAAPTIETLDAALRHGLINVAVILTHKGIKPTPQMIEEMANATFVADMASLIK
jgi:hypothetical protein